MAEKKITLRTSDGMNIAFQCSQDLFEQVFESLFDKAKLDNETVQNIILNSEDEEFVVNTLVYYEDIINAEDIEFCYKQNLKKERILCAIAGTIKTPEWIIKELMDHPDELISKTAKEEWEQRKVCPQCKGSGRKSPCMGIICEYCNGTGKI